MSRFNVDEAAAPALAVIAQMEDTAAPVKHTTRTLDTVATVREDGTENKTARLELVMRPSAKAALKAAAKAEGRTVNDLVNRIVEAYLEGRD